MQSSQATDAATLDTGRFTVVDTPLQGLRIVRNKPFIDHRGEFTRLYCQDEYAQAGLGRPVVQINRSRTLRRGSIRGMHFQRAPHTEDKIVSCVAGRVFDVAVDLRRGSPTFLAWFGLELSPASQTSLLIPAGFAHGFQSLEDHSEIIYFVTARYDASAEDGLNPMDPSIAIDWPLPCTDISVKDGERPFISGADHDGL